MPVPIKTIEIVLAVEVPQDIPQKDLDALLSHCEAGDLATTSGLDYCITDGWINDEDD